VTESHDEVIEVTTTIDPSLLRKRKGKQAATADEQGDSGAPIDVQIFHDTEGSGTDVIEEATLGHEDAPVPSKKRKRPDADDSVILYPQRATSSSTSGTVSLPQSVSLLASVANVPRWQYKWQINDLPLRPEDLGSRLSFQ